MNVRLPPKASDFRQRRRQLRKCSLRAERSPPMPIRRQQFSERFRNFWISDQDGLQLVAERRLNRRNKIVLDLEKIC